MSTALREVLALLDMKVAGADVVAKAQTQVDHFRATMQKPLAKLGGERISDADFAGVLRGNILNLGKDLQAFHAKTTEEAVPATHELNLSMLNLAAGVNIVQGALAGARAAYSATISPLIGMLEHVIALGDQLDATSQRTGMSAEELQRWRFIAAKGNVDADGLTNAVGRLQKAAVLTPKAFRGLGVEVKDATGHVKGASQLFEETGLAIAAIQNPAERTARAQAIFGRAGAALLPIFADGSASLEEMKKRFHELGGGLGGDVVKNAHEASDAMVDWNLALTTVQGNLARSVLPTLTHVIEVGADVAAGFAEVANKSSMLQAAALDAAIAGGVLAIAFWEVTLPAAAIVLALGALYLITEDVITASRGGKSVFGEWAEALAAATGQTITFQGILEQWSIGWLQTKADILGAEAAVLRFASSLRQAMGMADDPILDRMANIAGAQSREAGSAAGSAAFDLRKHEEQRQADRADRAIRDSLAAHVPDAAIIAKHQADQHDRPSDRWSRSDQRGKLAVRAQIAIHVNGAQDAHHTARAVREEIQTALQDTADDLPSGGDEAEGGP